MISSIYLSGSTIDPEQFLVDPALLPDWRSKATTRLQQSGFRVLNPLEFAFFADEKNLAIERRVRQSLNLIDQCDALLANLNKPSYGTAMEMFYAYRRGKMVTVVGQSPFSPWVVSHSKARFDDVDRALEFLIGEAPQQDPLNWALQYERLLSEHYEQLPPDGEADYEFFGGELPLLVVAPHATAFFHEGQFQEQEAYTGSLAALLSKLSRCHSLISSYCCVADPMHYWKTPLGRAFTDITKVGEVGMVVVLSGASWHDTPGLQLTVQGPEGSNYDDFAGRARLHMSALEPVLPEEPETYLTPFVKYCLGELKVPTMVLRVHRRYRMPRLQPEPFLKLVNLLTELISETGLELLRGRL